MQETVVSFEKSSDKTFTGEANMVVDFVTKNVANDCNDFNVFVDPPRLGPLFVENGQYNVYMYFCFLVI